MHGIERIGVRRGLKGARVAIALGAMLAAGAAQAEATRHGNWVTVRYGGVAGVATTFDNGSYLTLYAVGRRFLIGLHNPNWRLRRLSRVSLSASIDGHAPYVGSATATKRDAIDVGVSDPDFIRALAAGRRLEVIVLGSRWTMGLDGSRDALRHMFLHLLNR